MSPKLYSWIVSTCVLIVIFSAVTFDRVPVEYKRLAMVPALIAAVVSLFTYFYNRHLLRKQDLLAEISKLPSLKDVPFENIKIGDKILSVRNRPGVIQDIVAWDYHSIVIEWEGDEEPKLSMWYHHLIDERVKYISAD